MYCVNIITVLCYNLEKKHKISLPTTSPHLSAHHISDRSI